MTINLIVMLNIIMIVIYFYSIFTNFTFIQFLAFFIYSFIYGVYNILFSLIVKDYTICHIFLYYQFNVFESYFKEKNITIASIIINSVSILIEIFITLVFLEIIELKFCGINQDIKENIGKRAIKDVDETDSDNNSFLSDVYSDDDYITRFKELKEEDQENHNIKNDDYES